MVEQPLDKGKVEGSNPSSPTNGRMCCNWIAQLPTKEQVQVRILVWSPMAEEVTISKERLVELEKFEAWLSCLEAAGVNNWDGWDQARGMFEVDYPEYNED